ncbi:uncharacterized protein [Oryctolagus cuniculus]|uniref:uncharacterized protein n=1 Tax=Oryctolagus cuniculus TaxID=9986 RepID=UPI003879C37A
MSPLGDGAVAPRCGPQDPKELATPSRLHSAKPTGPRGKLATRRPGLPEVSGATANATQREVGRTRSRRLQSRKLLWLDPDRPAREAGTWRGAGPTEASVAWTCASVRAWEHGGPKLPSPLFSTWSPSKPSSDFTARRRWLGAPSTPPIAAARLPSAEPGPERSIPGCLLGTSLGKGAEQLPAASSICCAFFLRHNKSQIN